MADFLEEKKKEINQRMDELRPLVDEYHRLEAAHRALEGVNNGGSSGSARASSSTTSRRTSRGGGGGGGRGRPKGSGTRANEALAAVREQPGITIPEMAQKMGIQQNYLYRVLPGLEQDGKVRKEGRGWFAKDAA
jgi:predicted Rossmann fold nucleotide-binding protein DprA/Smf involved in DNA uptake